MPNLQVVKGFEDSTVYVTEGGRRLKIDLANATKAQLQLLQKRGHPAVEEKPTKGKDETPSD